MIVQSLTKIMAFVVAAAGLFALCAYAAGGGWSFALPQPWTCVGLLAAGVCLSIALSDSSRSGFKSFPYVLAGLVFAIGFMDWVEILTGLNTGFDKLLFPHSLAVASYPGRPAPATGFNLLMIGISLLLYRSKRTLTAVMREAAAVSAFTYCYLTLANLAIRAPIPATRESISPFSAVCLVIFSAALLLSRPDGKLLTLLKSSGSAGIFARWLIPMPLVVPVLTNVVRKVGVTLGIFDPKAGASSIIAFVDILCALFIVWGASGQVFRLDRLKQKAEQALRDSRDDLDRQVRLRTHELVLSNEQLRAEIGERHRAEQELHIANATLNNLIEASPLAILALDTDGSIRKRNTAAEALLRRGAAPFQQLIDRAKHGEVIAGAEAVEPTPEGQVVYQIWASPLFTAAGTQNGTLVLATDISERKAFDAKLLQTQKLESLGVLAGGIAHDFNNLLTGIMGNASLLLETYGADELTAPMLEQVLRAAGRAADLTGQMLAYAGKGRFIVAPMDLSELVREISALIRSSVGKQIRLRLELDDKLPLMMMDSSQIQQVVMNLVINAAEAIAGTGEVVVSTAVQNLDADFIRLELKEADLPAGRYVSLEVRDNGPGMSEQTKARIFEPFFTTKFTGRGLGLAAVHGILRSHKGGLMLQSELEKGTTFRLFFPAFENLGAAELTSAPARRPPGARAGKVLVIDDELVVREAASNTLKTLGFQVETVDSGALGIARLAVNPHDLDAIILDLTMPGLSGRDTYLQLKELAPDIPVILSSGFDEAEAERYFDGTPFDAFLHKPYTADQLSAKLFPLCNPASAAAGS